MDGAPAAKPATQTDPFTAPVVTLPKGGGALRGVGETFNVAGATGTGTCTIPVTVTPGRDGFGPDLALRYDSGSGNGPYGLGFTLAVPTITRKTDKRLPQYRDADTFLLSDAEELVATDVIEDPTWVISRFRPRTEGLFSRIERCHRKSDGDEHWRTISRENVTTIFGQDTSARIADPDDGTRIYCWLAQVSTDDRGNAIVYEYKAEDGVGASLDARHERNRRPADRSSNRYLKRIHYGNRVSALTDPTLSAPDWAFEVVLDYGEHDPVAPAPAEIQPWPARLDAFSRYKAGFEIRTYRLCRRVLMFHHFPDDPAVGADCLVRSTDLEYTEDPTVSLLTKVTAAGYRRTPTGYLRRTLPPLTLDYTPLTWNDTVVDAPADTAAALPAGFATPGVSYLDLDGDGIPGALYTGSYGWHYGAGTGKATFAPPVALPTVPSGRPVGDGGRRLLDLTATGTLDVVDLRAPAPGFFARGDGGDWDAFTAFADVPTVDLDDPDVRMVDLDGDGRADLLITCDDELRWHPALGPLGYAPALTRPAGPDEESGPRLVFHDATESLHLADMSGDGLADLVRVRDREVCYWPNLGYGRFGAKVALDGAPWLARSDKFEPRYVRLADIDGSGTADLVYLDGSGARIWRNQAGNSFASVHAVAGFPPAEDVATVSIVDLLGTGTSCLVWSSPLPGDTRRPLRYVDLLGSVKPYLLAGLVNNMGAETRVHYTSSVQFLLADKAAGRPWATRLPFPVQVVDRVDTYDRISRNWFVSRYAYHHGYFDAAEREFRGFGMIERWDTDQIGAVTVDPPPGISNGDPAASVPPVHTKTWYHTGVLVGGDVVSRHLAEEYWTDGLPPAQAAAMLLADTVLPATVLHEDGTRTPYAPTPGELRDAVRALRGSMLREEVYADDGTGLADRPYRIIERNYTLDLLAPRGSNPHAVCISQPRETVTWDFERGDEARVSHEAVLDTDGYGNVRRSVAIGYPRLVPAAGPGLDPDSLTFLHQAQGRMLIRLTDTVYTNAVDTATARRTPRVADTRSYALVHLHPAANLPGVTNLFTFDELVLGAAAASDGLHDLAAEDVDAAGAVTPAPYRRLLDRTRQLYRADDLSAALPSGQLESLALPHSRLRLAFTPSQVAALYLRDGIDLLGGPVAAAALAAEGGYVVDADGWWTRSALIGYSPSAADPPATELAQARAHYFRPRRFTDPFGNTTALEWGSSDLLCTSVTDPLHNATVAVAVDHRVMAPVVIADPNGNRSAVVHDALGRVAATAVMGKLGGGEGDTLSGVDPDPSDAAVAAFFANPLGSGPGLLVGASTRYVYDLDAYQRTAGDPEPQPAVAALVSRTRHVSDPTPGTTVYRFEYSDGFARVIQAKTQAEPGPVVDGGPDVNPRWAGSGWSVRDNKGNVVRRYEPFFSATHGFEDDRAAGVSSVSFYDPLGRVRVTMHPDHSYQKTVIDPWQQTVYDRNDTVLLDPRADPDTAAFVAGYAATLPSGWQTWHQAALAGSPDDVDAATKAAAHAATPAISHTDALTRVVLAVSHLRNATTDKLLSIRSVYDVPGTLLDTIDQLGRANRTSRFDLLGRAAKAGGADSGIVYTLPDVAGAPIRFWDARGNVTRSTYDAGRRLLAIFVDGGGGERLRGRNVYGEAAPAATVGNLRTRVFRQLDGSGLAENSGFDFTGNLVRSSRRLATGYRDQADWTALAGVSDQVLASTIPAGVDNAVEYVTGSRYDALNRVVETTSADGSITRPTYNEASLLDRIDVAVRAAVLGGQPVFDAMVANVDYNARGQRTAIAYGNGAAAALTYDPATFRLTDAVTTRPTAPGRVQGLHYHYDPVGNVTRRGDDAQQMVFYANAVVSADMDFTYDSLYQLTNAGGREHIGQAAGPAPDWNDAARSRQPLGSDGQAMRGYTEDYGFDDAGNMTSVVHQAVGGNWTRTYKYGENSALVPAEPSNRLTSTTIGAVTEPYSYDAHGNLTSTAQVAALDWDDRDRLHRADLGGGGTMYAAYASDGSRVRKVVERQNGSLQYEWIYLPGVEIYREYDGAGAHVTLERQSLHVHDGERRFALVETRTVGVDPGLAEITRYQIPDHLGSSCVELDETAAVVSYEEYYPFGATSYQAVRAATETPKRYRYVGRERDPETGFTYHGARYYLPWLGRWSAIDPAGTVDGLNPYVYVRNRPTGLADPSGLEGVDPNKPKPNAATPKADAAGSANAGGAQKPPAAQDAAQTPSATAPAAGTKGQNAAAPAAGQAEEDGPDLPNSYNATVVQGTGVITDGKIEAEAGVLLGGNRITGLGAGGANYGGGVSSAYALFRKQFLFKGLDAGFQLNGSVLSQGTDSSTLTTRGLLLGPTAHYGWKPKDPTLLGGTIGFGVYGSAFVAGQASKEGKSESQGGQGVLAGAWEKDPTDSISVTSIAVNAVGGGATAGGLSQGPNLTTLWNAGGVVGVGVGFNKNWGGTAEFSYTHNAGSPDNSPKSTTPGQSASSDVVRFGVVGQRTWGGTHGEAGKALSLGVWFQHEIGKVSGPATTDSPTGSFTTNTLLIGLNYAWRGGP